MVALLMATLKHCVRCSAHTSKGKLLRHVPTTTFVYDDSDAGSTTNTQKARLCLKPEGPCINSTHLSSSRLALNLAVADSDTTEREEASPAEAAVAAAAFVGVLADAAAICDGKSSAPPSNSLRRSPGDLAFSISDVEVPSAATRGATPALSRAL